MNFRWQSPQSRAQSPIDVCGDNLCRLGKFSRLKVCGFTVGGDQYMIEAWSSVSPGYCMQSDLPTRQVTQ